MHIAKMEGKRRIFSLVLLIREHKEVWVEELARLGYTRPTSRLYLGILEDYHLIEGSWSIRDDSKGVRRVFRLTRQGNEIAELLLDLDKRLGAGKGKDLR